MQIIDKIIKFLFSALIFLTPLIVLPMTSELFEFNKILLIYLITTLISFFWILKMILAKRIIFKKNLFGLFLILFFLSQVLATFFSIDVHTSLFGYYGRFNGGLVSTLCYGVLYFAFVSLMKREFVFKILKISLFSSFLVILWGLPGRFNYDLSCYLFTGQFNNSCWTNQFQPAVRMFSTLGQPNWLGAYLAVNFFIGIYFFIENQKNLKYLLLTTIYLLLCFVSILFTRSRSSLGAVGISLGLFLLYYFFVYKKNFQKIILLLVLILASVVIFKTGIEKIDKYFSISNFQFPISKFQSPVSSLQSPVFNSLVTESLDIRKIVWQGAIALGLKYPFFGTGVETFAYSYYFTRPTEHNLTSEWDYLYNKAHNEYLNYLATTGFIGLGMYLLLIFNQFFLLRQGFAGQVIFKLSKVKEITQNKLPITDYLLLITCLSLSYLTILITNFFGFSITSISLYFYLIPAFVFILTSPTYLSSEAMSDMAKEDEVKGQSTKINFRQGLLIFFLAGVSLYLLVSIFTYFLADIKYAQADSYVKNNDYQTASQLLSQALRLRSEHVYQDKLSYGLANLAFVASYGKQKDLAKKLIALSNFYNKNTLQVASKNVLYFKTQAKNNYLFYQTELDKKYLEIGLEALKKAQILSPTDPKIPYSLAIYYSLLFDEIKDVGLRKKYEQLSLDYINQSLKLKFNLPDSIELKKQLEKKFEEVK